MERRRLLDHDLHPADPGPEADMTDLDHVDLHPDSGPEADMTDLKRFAMIRPPDQYNEGYGVYDGHDDEDLNGMNESLCFDPSFFFFFRY